MAKEGILPMEERMKHAEAQINSDLTQEQYAKQHGFPTSKIGYWVKQYNEKHGITPTRGGKKPKPVTATLAAPQQSSALVHDEMHHLKAEISGLQFQVNDLIEQNEGLREKIKALHAIIELAGHQMVRD